MASAAQRRKKRIERKVKAQGSSRVTPAEVINLLSAASAIEPSSATTEKVSVATEPNPATLKPAEAPTKSKHLEPLPQFSAVHVAVSKPHYGHAKPPAAVDRIQDQLAPEPLRRRSLKVGALRDRVAVACCLIRHQFSDWLGELSKPAFERAVDMIAQRSLQLAAAVQPISRPIQQQFERLPLHLFGLEMWARSRRKQLAAGSAASLLAVTAFATAPFSEEALPPPQMLAESLVAASTVFDFHETLVVEHLYVPCSA